MQNENNLQRNSTPTTQGAPTPTKVNNIDKIITICKKQGATDIHLAVGQPPICRINGDIIRKD